jgi:hypothetical protein
LRYRSAPSPVHFVPSRAGGGAPPLCCRPGSFPAGPVSESLPERVSVVEPEDFDEGRDFEDPPNDPFRTRDFETALLFERCSVADDKRT